MSEHLNDAHIDGKLLPFSQEAEQSVLGAILVDPPSINLIMDKLKPVHFFIKKNRAVFDILCSMSVAQQTIDFITILERIKQLPENESRKANDTRPFEPLFKEGEAKAYLTQIVQSVPTSANITTYADIVLEKYHIRALMEASQDILTMAQSGSVDASQLLEAAETKIYDIRQGKDVTGLHLLDDIIKSETFVRLSKISDPETRKDYIGIPTGFSELDRIITGLNRSDLIIVGARPGMGKTAFALNIARNVSMQSGKTVCFFSLEMSRDQLAQRLLSSEAMIESGKMRTGDLTPDEWTRLTQAGLNLAQAKMYIDETPGITVPEIMAKLRRMKDTPDLVIIDYLGLIQSAKRTENRVQEVSDITRNLKIMAKKMQIPVIVCAQLSRGTEGKNVRSHKPQLSDLRESGSIEQDADIVLFMYRDLYYKNDNDDPNNPVDEHKAECIVAKNRHGGLDSVHLYWDGAYTRFSTPDKNGIY